MNQSHTFNFAKRTLQTFLSLILLGSLGACRHAKTEAINFTNATSEPTNDGDFKVAPVTGPTVVARATEKALTPGSPLDPCLSPAALAKPLGSHRYSALDAVFKDLPGEFLRPDEKTIPSDARFWEAHFYSVMFEGTRQSAMTLVWHLGAPKAPKGLTLPTIPTAMFQSELSISQMAGSRIADPPLDPHQRLILRDLVAYGFNPPFEVGGHSLTWKEGCRWISIIAPLPASDLIKIAEGLHKDG